MLPSATVKKAVSSINSKTDIKGTPRGVPFATGVIMKYKAVIFDLDGTLVDTLEDLADSVNYALDSFGFPHRSIDEVRSFIGNGVRRLIYLSVPEGTENETSEKCLEIFRNHYKSNSRNKTNPYEGITETLDRLSESGIRTAVVTNKMQEAAKDIVEFYFGEKINLTVGQVDGVSQKPSPDGVNLVLKTLGISKEEAIYVGDSEVDCITASNAGIDCIGVTWGFREKKVLEENGARFIAESPQEILSFI